MASSPDFKIYRDGEYIAACKYPEDAAAVVSMAGSGTVKFRHKLIVWREGQEEIPAYESFDRAAEIMRARIDAAARA